MRRRKFIKLMGGAAVAWPIAARAEQSERVRRIAVLIGTAATGQNPAAYAAVLRRLGVLGWTDGRNVRIEVRWANGDPELMRNYGKELASHSPDVFFVQSNPALAALRPLAGNSPIVFTQVADPVGSGFVTSLARPGSNITGFTNFEPSMGSKWLEAGGLLSYGVDALDLVPRAADYVDRILRGVHPGELPVQAPTKFDLVINLKTAKTLCLTVPPALLAQADEVIE